MELTKKARTKITVLYGIITIFANLFAVLIPSNFSCISTQTMYQEEWISFLEKHSTFFTIITVITFIIPGILCYLYAKNSKGEKFFSRFINLPIAFSLFGITGWIFYFFAEIITLLFAKKNFSIQISPILISSFMYVLLESLFSFSLSYFVMDFLHRNKYLPIFFPDGHLHKIKGTINPSLKFLFTALYISVVVFPIIYLIATVIAILSNNNLHIDKNNFIIFCLIFTIGLFVFVIFTSYFNSPLKKLQKNAEQIKNGNFNSKVKIIANDSFGLLADTFNEMSVSIEEKTLKILQIQNSIITGMATMVESRDNSTGGHIKRTSECVKLFVNELIKHNNYKNLSKSFCENLVKAAPMHDLGKIAVDDSILRKPGKFTDDEYEKMKNHSKEGAKIIENVLSEVDDNDFKQIAINVAHYHHEKFNGQGYPEKLKGEQIPFEARIMALADVFDALVSKRCYKDTFSYDKAFSIINESLESHFDPNLGKIFIECRPKLEKLYDEIYNNADTQSAKKL